jgi:hypothetical protein
VLAIGGEGGGRESEARITSRYSASGGRLDEIKSVFLPPLVG